MDGITSIDGTRITWTRSGSGPPLVLVHGSGASSVRWGPVLPGLEAHFSVYAVDRRGYRESGDSPTYEIEREFEDIAAVVDSIGQPVNLLGHSYGALCVLEAALLTRNIRRLILYEPSIPRPGVALYPEGSLERLQALLDAGDREGMITALFREIVQMSDAEFEKFKASPAWPVRIAAAHIVLRESLTEANYSFEADRFAEMNVPTLLLLGGESPASIRAGTEAVHAALPEGQIAVLPGQQHIAMDTAPELFLQEVLAFLRHPA